MESKEKLWELSKNTYWYGHVIKSNRQLLGLTQHQLAQACSVSVGLIRRIENNETVNINSLRNVTREMLGLLLIEETKSEVNHGDILP